MKHPLLALVGALVLVATLSGSPPTAQSFASRAAREGQTTSFQLAPQALHTVYVPLVRKENPFLNVSLGDGVARSISVIGKYPAQVLEDLWVFVVPLGGRYYPQSYNACGRERTPKYNGLWEMRVNFGGNNDVGIRFQIILTSANAAASQLIVDTLKAWCDAGDHPGFEKLPEGITVLDWIEVVRTSEIWGRAPLVSNTDLPGSVAITSPVDGAQVLQSTTVKGTYSSDTLADIWVLVYATNGRWYPQSRDACRGRPALKSNGQWQTPTVFGDKNRNVGEPFDTLAVLANAQASVFFSTILTQWCDNGRYLGLVTIELPQGITEKSRIRVIRR
jgi:hypothetical protein